MQRSDHQNFKFLSSCTRFIIFFHVVFLHAGPINVAGWAGDERGSSVAAQLQGRLAASQELYKQVEAADEYM